MTWKLKGLKSVGQWRTLFITKACTNCAPRPKKNNSACQKFGLGVFVCFGLFFFLRSSTHFSNSYGTDSGHWRLWCQNLTHSNYYHSMQKTKETQILSTLILAMAKSYCLHRGLKQSSTNGSWVKQYRAFRAWPVLKEQGDSGDTMRACHYKDLFIATLGPQLPGSFQKKPSIREKPI